MSIIEASQSLEEKDADINHRNGDSRWRASFVKKKV